MRVVVAHNFYRSEMPSGENRAVEHQVEALRSEGVEVALYGRSSDEIADFGPFAKVSLAWRPLYSWEDAHRFGALLSSFRPDVVNLHNPFPLLSPAVVNVADRMHIPVVQTVHNYRHGCPAGTLFRDGHICEECLGRSIAWPAVQHGCYRGSHVQGVPIALAQSLHKPAWRKVARYLAVSDFIAEKLIATGISAARVRVLANGADDPGPPQPLGRGFVFVGRLDETKGISLLLDAWKLARFDPASRLVVIGDGPERALVESHAAGDPTVEYRGTLPFAEVARAMDDAAVVVIPSVWYEGFPVVAAEALSRGRPMLVSDLGSLHDIVDERVGWRAAPNASAFAAALEIAAGSNNLTALAANAREKFLGSLRRDTVTKALVTHLAETIDEARAHSN